MFVTSRLVESRITPSRSWTQSIDLRMHICECQWTSGFAVGAVCIHCCILVNVSFDEICELLIMRPRAHWLRVLSWGVFFRSVVVWWLISVAKEPGRLFGLLLHIVENICDPAQCLGWVARIRPPYCGGWVECAWPQPCHIIWSNDIATPARARRFIWDMLCNNVPQEFTLVLRDPPFITHALSWTWRPIWQSCDSTWLSLRARVAMTLYEPRVLTSEVSHLWMIYAMDT